MECDTCQREHDENLPFYCTNCARNIAYLPRLELAQVLLEKDQLAKQIEEILAKDTGSEEAPSQTLSPNEGRATWQAEIKQVEVNDLKHNIEQIRQDADRVKQESKELRDHMEKLQIEITARRKNLQIMQAKLDEEMQTKIPQLQDQLSKEKFKSAKLSEKFAANRATICREAASLMRFRQRRKPKDAVGREQYSIAGLTLPDLRQISNIRCTDLTAVLGSVARLVVLIAFYLGVRLPAEIVLPHADYPVTTVNLPRGSYLGKPSDSSSPSATVDQGSPSASRHESGTPVVPRPLYLGTTGKSDERVFQLQQKQESAFNFFLEAIALLAWNVAWLCRTQGFTSGTDSWEDICDMGKNLHSLIFTQPPTPSLMRLASDKSVRRTLQQEKPSASPKQTIRKDAGAILGKFSDLSSNNLGSGQEKSETVLSWKYARWQAVAAPLRKILYEENVSAEWELLKDQEWDDGGEQFDEAVFIKSRALDGQQYDDARSIMTTRTKVEDDTPTANRIPGTSGWTKLKSREKS